MSQVKLQDKKLSSNPFNTYRDPKTGRWVVVRSKSAIKGDRVELLSRAA
ncbi:MAG: hypothetical protein SXA11_04185 [Cyanobacteriota bacterium]|nr:hypothetical protein [Cyanobacteriota bacterium]